MAGAGGITESLLLQLKVLTASFSKNMHPYLKGQARVRQVDNFVVTVVLSPTSLYFCSHAVHNK